MKYCSYTKDRLGPCTRIVRKLLLAYHFNPYPAGLNLVKPCNKSRPKSVNTFILTALLIIQ
jgi:hypothetical protein